MKNIKYNAQNTVLLAYKTHLKEKYKTKKKNIKTCVYIKQQKRKK